MVLRSVRAAALFLLGVYAGGVVFVLLAPGLLTLPATAYVPYWQALNSDYSASMPVLLLSGLALLVATAVLSARRGRLAWGLALLAAVLVGLTVVITVTQMEPLNLLADGWDPAVPPLDWAEVRDEWMWWHRLRAALAAAAFASLLASGVLTDRPIRGEAARTAGARAAVPG